eukprot:CAMPEP_0117757500 /NCGR_PEP_ID=MMETSP0947-20121206/14776_1 /TAXON_ID=44440 /ORGANISM="Chattonella subsalsa, Strain CCMP2191" /LENGTH=143 /DNA_ID=CAMNT_0005577421 /DNA_START=41 /DNA_END=472 /DNA_ORIENTATION=-
MNRGLFWKFLSTIIVLFIYCLTISEGRWGQGGRVGVETRKEMELQAELYEQVKDEAEDLTEDEMMEKLAELRALKKEEMKRKEQERINARDPNDPWRNGTYVRYMAKTMGIILVGIMLYAFKDGLDDPKAKKRKQKEGANKYN